MVIFIQKFAAITMSKTRFLLPIILAVTTCWASIPVPTEFVSKTLDDLPNYRLPTNIKPTYYDITLQPIFNTSNDESFTFKGISVIELNVKEPTDKIIFHARNLNISSASIEILTNPYAEPSLNITNIIYDEVEQRDFVTLILNKNVSLDVPLRLTLNYIGKLNDDLRGFYRSSYKNEAGEEV